MNQEKETLEFPSVFMKIFQEREKLMNNESNTRNPLQVFHLNLISIDFSFSLSGALWLWKEQKVKTTELRWLSTISNQSPLFIFQFKLDGFLITRSSCFFRAAEFSSRYDYFDSSLILLHYDGGKIYFRRLNEGNLDNQSNAFHQIILDMMMMLLRCNYRLCLALFKGDKFISRCERKKKSIISPSEQTHFNDTKSLVKTLPLVF